MIRKLLLFLALTTSLALAQGSQRIGQATQNSNGFVKVTSGAAVTVCTYPNCLAATMYSDVALTAPITQPLHADENGNYMYFVSAGNYWENVSSPGTTAVTTFISLDQGVVANFASPPPIGNVTPNTGEFTNLNKVIMADAAAGSDACAKITNAVSSATATGQVVNAMGFVGAQTCASTMIISKPVKLLFGNTSFTLNGNPGILVTSPKSPQFVGAGWEYSYTPSGTSGTVFASGISAPLMEDIGSAGALYQGIEFNGNSVGTLGVFMGVNGGSGATFRDVHFHHFLYTCFIAPGALTTDGLQLVNNCGGDGYLVGSAPVIGGNTQFDLIGGNGIHAIGESAQVTNPNVNRPGLSGLYFDGRIPPDWTSATTFVSPSIIKPLTSNAGGYYFYSLNVNCTTSGFNPTWPQTVAATVTDNSCIWINVSTFNNGGAPVPGNAGNVVLSGANILNAGTSTYGSYKPDNIRFEGNSAGIPTCFDNSITGSWIDMEPSSGPNTFIGNGLHLLNCIDSTVTGLTFTGRSYGNTVPASDGYALLIENGYDNTVTNVTSKFASKSPIKLVNTFSNVLSNIATTCSTNQFTTSPDTYNVQVDTTSDGNQINGLKISLNCGRPNERGVYNAGTFTNLYINGYAEIPVGTQLDSFGNSTYLVNNYNRNTGIPIEFSFYGDPWLQAGGFNSHPIAIFGHGLAFGTSTFEKMYDTAGSLSIDEGANGIGIWDKNHGTQFWTFSGVNGDITGVSHFDASRLFPVTGVAPASALGTGGAGGGNLVLLDNTAFGKVTNAALVNPSTTVNGATCTLGSSCTPAPTVSGTPTAGAGVCWKTATQLGTCTAGTWPNCSVCN